MMQDSIEVKCQESFESGVGFVLMLLATQGITEASIDVLMSQAAVVCASGKITFIERSK